MIRALTFALLMILGIAASSCGRGPSSGSSNGSGSSNASSVIVTPATANVYLGMTAQFQAQVVGHDNQAVTWSVEDGIGTINSAGLYTAPRDSSGGPFHVVATSQADSSAKGAAAVTVLVPEVTIAPST